MIPILTRLFLAMQNEYSDYTYAWTVTSSDGTELASGSGSSVAVSRRATLVPKGNHSSRCLTITILYYRPIRLDAVLALGFFTTNTLGSLGLLFPTWLSVR
jgi:hypothetical protein